MKKFNIILLLTVVVIVFVSGCSSDIFQSVSEIELTNLQTRESTVIERNSQTGKVILKAIKTKEKTEDDISNLTIYELKLKKKSHEEYYKLSFDLEKERAYVSQDDNNYVISSDHAEKLFSDENFYYIYIDNSLYKAYVDYNENKLNPQIKYDWTYTDIKDYTSKKEGTIEGDMEKAIEISEKDALDIVYARVPDSQVVKAYSKDTLVSTGTNIQDILNSITTDGEYMIEIRAQWRQRKDSDPYGYQTLVFSVNVDRPARPVIVTRENYPGNMLIVSVENINQEETVSLETDVVKTEITGYEHKGKRVFICPIDLNAQPGEYDINITVDKGASKEYSITSSFEVKNKSFKTQYLSVSDEMNDTNNDDAAIYEFAQLVKPARAESAPEKLWEGTFSMPVEGEVTTDFAEIRYVNNELSSSRHSGLDIAAPLGTEIKAPNNGVVTFAMEGLLSPGNTVVVDHGMGLFTSYYHMDTLAVKKGQKISKGDVIGTVGTTGFSTGPHLHYAVSIFNIYVNPYQTLSGIID